MGAGVGGTVRAEEGMEAEWWERNNRGRGSGRMRE